MELASLIVETFLFFLPAGIANIVPVLVTKLPILKMPMDFGFSFRGERILGDHKTWRGFVFGVFSAILAAHLFATFGLVSSVRVGVGVSWLGLLLGAGALLGDAVKSFFKRQISIKPGGSWVPFDQLDWVLGALIAVHFFGRPLSPATWITALLLFGLLHPLINLLGYWLKIKKNKF